MSTADAKRTRAPGTVHPAEPQHRYEGTVWVCSELYHPERTSTGRFLTGIAEGLAGHYRVRVLCSQPTYSARGTTAPRTERRNGVEIRRCRSTRLDKNVLLFRTLNAVTLAFSAVWTLSRRLAAGDVILVVTNPPLFPLVFAPLAKWRGAQLIVLVHDLYPEVLVATGMRAHDSLTVRLLRRAYDYVFRTAARTIALGRDMRDVIRRRLPAAAGRAIIIPNWAELDVIAPRPRAGNRLLTQLQLEDRFVVQYLGNMGRTHDIGILVEAARRLRADQDVAFLFVGAGARRDWLVNTISAEKLSNVHVVPECSDADLPEYVNACDLSVIPFLAGMRGVSVPSRMYNVMGAGKPIVGIADVDSELASVIVEEHCGWRLHPGDVEGLVHLIRRLRRAPEELRERGENGRRAAQRRYSESVVIERYRDLVADLVASP